MSLGTIFKVIIFFAGTGAAIFVVAQILFNKEPRMLPDKAVRGTVEEKGGDFVDSARKAIVNKVLPAVAGNPILEPALETKKSVEETIETVMSLPREQKEAVCKQVCQ